jgi:hypothetical protein
MSGTKMPDDRTNSTESSRWRSRGPIDAPRGQETHTRLPGKWVSGRPLDTCQEGSTRAITRPGESRRPSRRKTGELGLERGQGNVYA